MTVRIFIVGRVVMHDIEGDAPPEQFEYAPDMAIVGEPKKLTATFFAPTHMCYYMGIGEDGVAEYEWQ